MGKICGVLKDDLKTNIPIALQRKHWPVFSLLLIYFIFELQLNSTLIQQGEEQLASSKSAPNLWRTYPVRPWDKSSTAGKTQSNDPAGLWDFHPNRLWMMWSPEALNPPKNSHSCNNFLNQQLFKLLQLQNCFYPFFKKIYFFKLALSSFYKKQGVYWLCIHHNF